MNQYQLTNQIPCSFSPVNLLTKKEYDRLVNLAEGATPQDIFLEWLTKVPYDWYLIDSWAFF